MPVLAKKLEDTNFQHLNVAVETPLTLDSGDSLSDVSIAYETYGSLNADRSNAILICHALTGDQFVASTHPITGKEGWWDSFVGPGKSIDTDKYFVICSNVLGGCMGSTGPMSANPATGKAYGLDFPVVTISDMVRAQKLLIDALGLEKLFAVVGGSMGGAQALEWAAHYPETVERAVVMAIGSRYSAQNIAFNEVSRQALIADPDWSQGSYQEAGKTPSSGLSVARMSKHITYMSEDALQQKFGRNLQDRNELSFGFEADFQIESYLRHQGISFVDRFDANSYLYLTRSFDYYDLEIEHGKPLSEIYKDSPVQFCLLSYSTDWFCPPIETREVAQALNAARASVAYQDIDFPRGHDSFLLDVPERDQFVKNFLDKNNNVVAKAENHTLAQDGRNIQAHFQIISDMVDDRCTVIDFGCADGSLLAYLKTVHSIRCSGVELSSDGVHAAVAKGLSVIQGNIEKSISQYADNSYDYAILSHTIQSMSDPKGILSQLLRVGKKAIVALPNFGHWSVRSHLFFKGTMPVTKSLPYTWYNTPNTHFCTLKDFDALCSDMGVTIERKIILDSHGNRCGKSFLSPNLFGQQAIYLLS